jgi:soluble lytic murein transglycosylase-like protein
VAVALALLSRQTGRVPPQGGDAQVDSPPGGSPARRYDRGDLDALINEAAALHGVSEHLVRAVVQAESAYDPAAVSPVGAQGLMQLMPNTATFLGVSDSLDPRQNVFGGTKYLSQLLERFDGDVALALAGYNAGPTRVARYRNIPPYGETRGYVVKIRGLLAESTGDLFPMPKPAALRPRQTRRSPRGRRT